MKKPEFRKMQKTECTIASDIQYEIFNTLNIEYEDFLADMTTEFYQEQVYPKVVDQMIIKYGYKKYSEYRDF